MIKFGIISEVDKKKCRVRVNFKDDNVVSDWLPLVFSSTLEKKIYIIPRVNTHVVCHMDEGLKDGYVAGCIYDDNNPPHLEDDKISAIKFPDGTEIFYDENTNKLTVKSAQEIIFDVAKLTVTGEIKANGEVTAGAAGPGVRLSTHVHVETGATTNSPTPGT